MAKKKRPKTTPEEEARQDENARRLRERIAERRALEREWDAQAAAEKK
jgi:hypothetical protein